MSAATILVLVGLGALLAAAHPFLTYPLSLALFRQDRSVRAPDPPRAARPSVAICLSVFNEAAVIDEKIEELLAHAGLYGPATVHVYADGCTDGTVDLLARYGDRIDLVASPERLGKSHGMATLLARSDSQLLMFTDANVRAPQTALLDLAAPFGDPAVGMTTVRLTYDNPRESAISAISALYWHLEEKVKALEDRTVGVIGVDGAMFVIRRDAYHAPPPSLIDDLYVSLMVLLDGLRAIRVPDVVVSERSATATREEHQRKARIACQAMNVHRALWPGIRRLPAAMVYGYVSHRLVKWMMPFSLATAAGCFAAAFAAIAGLLPAIAACVAGAAILAVGVRLRVGPAEFVWAAISALAGTARGVLESLFTGKSYTTWDPAFSVRVEAPPSGGNAAS